MPVRRCRRRSTRSPARRGGRARGGPTRRQDQGRRSPGRARPRRRAPRGGASSAAGRTWPGGCERRIPNRRRSGPTYASERTRFGSSRSARSPASAGSISGSSSSSDGTGNGQVHHSRGVEVLGDDAGRRDLRSPPLPYHVIGTIPQPTEVVPGRHPGGCRQAFVQFSWCGAVTDRPIGVPPGPRRSNRPGGAPAAPPTVACRSTSATAPSGVAPARPDPAAQPGSSASLRGRSAPERRGRRHAIESGRSQWGPVAARGRGAPGCRLRRTEPTDGWVSSQRERHRQCGGHQRDQRALSRTSEKGWRSRCARLGRHPRSAR